MALPRAQSHRQVPQTVREQLWLRAQALGGSAAKTIAAA
jgi:hypothetical protein